MGLASQFESIVQRQLDVHAAWIPVITPYKLGDYGLIADGVFQKIGNITDDFSITFTEDTGPGATLNFVSDDTTVIDLNAGATIDLNPAGEIKANVTYKFNKEKSILVQAPEINVSIIKEVNQIARKLDKADDWQRKFKVVYQVYVAKDPLIISTVEGGTEVTLHAEGDALKQFSIGSANIGFSLKTTKALGLQITGKTGVIALGLFKLNFLTGNVALLDGDETVEILDKVRLTDDI